MAKRTFLSGDSFLSLLFCCQLATLGLLRQTPTYSLWETEIAAYPTFSLWLARVLSVLVLAGIAIGISRGYNLLAHRRLLALQGILLITGAGITLYASFTLPLYLAGQTFIGIAHAWILACWAEYLASLKTTTRNRTIASSALAAVILFALLGLVPWITKAPLFLAIAVGSIVPLLVLAPLTATSARSGNPAIKNTASEARPLQSAMEQLPAELIVLMASYAMLFRMLVFFDFPVQNETLFFASASVLRIGGMALILAYLAHTHFTPSTRQIILPLLFLTVVGVALLPAQNTFMSSFSVAIVESSWTFFYTLMWLLLFELGRERGRFSLLVFLCGWTVMNTLLLVAAPLAALLKTQVSEGTLSLTALALVIIYTLSVGILLFRRKAVKPSRALRATSERSEADLLSWKEKQEAFYRTVAQEHQLTNREQEVFELLVQGYSLPAIEEKFVLSHSTIKGHARNVYRKFGVSSKQELIERVNHLRTREGENS